MEFEKHNKQSKDLSNSSENIEHAFTGNYRTIGIRSEKKPQRTQSNAPFKPVEDDLEDSEESVEERMERVIYNPKKRNFGNNNRYERPSRSHNKTFVTKQSQASTPGSGKNPYDLLGKYSNNRDEYADSYYNSNTPRHLSPPTIY